MNATSRVTYELSGSGQHQWKASCVNRPVRMAVHSATFSLQPPVTVNPARS